MDAIGMMRIITSERDEKMERIPNLITRIRELMNEGKLELRELAKIKADLWWLQGPYTFYAMDGISSPFEEIHDLWVEIGKINGIEDAGECNNKSMIKNLRRIEEITELELLSLHEVAAINRVPELLVRIEQILNEKRRILQPKEELSLIKSLIKARDHFVLRRTYDQTKWSSKIRGEVLETISQIDKVIDKVIDPVS